MTPGFSSNNLSRRSILAGTAAAFFTPSAVLAQTALPHLNIAGVPEDSITPALYAASAGLFKRYGISASIVGERSGSAIASGVLGGAFDIGKTGLVGLIVARAKNIPFVLVGAGGVSTSTAPIVGLLVKADSPIKTAADLNGKTVAVSALSDIFSLATQAWMDQNGGKAETIKQLEFPVSAVPEALISGRVDAGAVIEPVLQRALQDGRLRVLANAFDAIAPRFLYSGWFATADWTGRHQVEALAFNRAMRDASLYANSHRPQTVDALSQFTAVPAAIISKMTRVDYGAVLDPKLIQPVIDACAKYKFITASFDARELIAPSVRN
jgi:NitT/TauT family transport system substrate-binding protein